MKINYILRLYSCFFYELFIQIALWFLIAFITIYIFAINSTDQPHLFQFILWLTSGVYFVSSWYYGGQTLAMKAWKIKLEIPKKKQIYFLCTKIFFSVYWINFIFYFLYEYLIWSKAIFA
jgi:hypothetical protein